MEPRAFAVLCLLVEHRHRVVSKKELLDAVWKGETVTDAALATTLRTVRLAIGDTGRDQRFIRTVHRRGYQFVAPTAAAQSAAGTAGAVGEGEAPAWSRDVTRFCRTADGTRIAWAVTGAGAPLVRTANWLSQMDLERTVPAFAHWFEGLTRGRRLIRYDERGYGLSDRTTGFALEEWMEDLDAVVDAAGLGRFPLLGISQGGALGVAYAALRPERVSRLVLNAAYARGQLARARDAAERDAAHLDLKLTLAGWHAQNHSYQRFFGAQFFAGSAPHRWDEYMSFQQRSVSAAGGARFLEEQSRLDVSDLAGRVRCPTLIVHSRDDPRVPVSQARELAELIPDSRLVLLEGSNHLLTGDEPAWPRFLDEMYAFLAEDGPDPG
ncbi:alpha/beta fold hydrolase [Plantactinospora sp. WMMB334]|uniref:alpha/beta fold hydrolase n=1 Tax=Plantactinospora sp. WMMB334 TaxID=3404119 RepID=UPI003B9577AA